LRAEAEVVRTTLQRNLSGLLDRGLIRERDRSYEITPAGALVATGLSDALERIGAATRLQPVLERLPARTFPFDVERLADATVVESTPANPYGPVEHHAATLVDADRARLLLPAAGAEPIDASRESDGAFELVVTESVAETLRTESPIADELATFDGDAVTISVVEDAIPFYLGVVDGAAQIGVHDDNGVPTALLESTDERVREWALDRFRSFEERSTAADLP
jgi:predicted transcriptional regulator